MNKEQQPNGLRQPALQQTNVSCRSIYMSSKVKYAQQWVELRQRGYNIISSWIDEGIPDNEEDFRDLSIRCIEQPKNADFTIVYCREGDVLKYALIEMGAALANNKKIIIVGHCDSISQTMRHHPNVLSVDTIEDALNFVNGC